VTRVTGGDAAAAITTQQMLDWVRSFAAVVADQKQYLTELDSAIGDADHGINMNRGMQAALERLGGEPPADVTAAMRTVAMALISKVGGAGGPLYGSFFLQFGAAAGGRAEISPSEWAEGLAAGIEAVQSRGKAEPGDKTMIDALLPARDALRAALADGDGFPEAIGKAADAAEEGMVATIPLVARKGRASYLGERSAGHQDPGATSSALLLRTAARTWGAG
jgi:phosphoenolpyruvate---glycerone phosphotransferase subunit DhaL